MDRQAFQQRLLGGAAAIALLTAGTAAKAQDLTFNIEPQSLASALNQFGAQSDTAVLVRPDLAASKTTRGVTGAASAEVALNTLLEGTGLTFRRDGDTFLIVKADQAPQGGSAAGGGATVEALIVTAQKREEDIQDVPIAISAFSQEDLTRSQVAGGPDLVTQVPNMTFTKTNFSSYSVQLRGIGTQAISATTDPAVAVAFNNTPFIRNRFFEQEFYDLQRVEVLRGPQGTLYGRNATAGVVNIISAKPRFIFEARASADIANYNSSRVEGMVNIPLVEDAVALRIAGAWTKRDGYAFNQITGSPIDGRDLWSTRVSVRFAPANAPFDLNLIWEHFEESDDRLRSGKQLCDKHFVTEIGGVEVDPFQNLPDSGQGGEAVQGVLSQGCERNSLYSPESFQTVNGRSVPYYHPATAIGLAAPLEDPYLSTVQSRDLRVIESTTDPLYSAESDLGELQFSFDVSESLTLTSETAYATDFVYSLQDFNRFNTAPGAWGVNPANGAEPSGVLQRGPNGFKEWCDPQLGCSDRLLAVDVSTAAATQFSQELRLASDFDAPFNFSLGVNYLRADSEDKYYVFINSISQLAAVRGDAYQGFPYIPGVTENRLCMLNPIEGDPAVGGGYTCVYMEQNPISEIEDQGHNYFLSKNPYKLISYAVFGEAYYQISEKLKLTAGLRYTVDQKEAPRIPSWILIADSIGYPVLEVEEQEWREPTGRLAVDWKPDLSFTDETLLYFSYAHGYKAGGSNPPTYAGFGVRKSATRPKTFDAEFVDAFEIGSKNTLADGRVTLNAAAFYYDYKDYQISEIVDRSAFNRNFDTTVWGVEVEADWRPLENLRLGLKGGYEDTRIADGEQAIDLMDRTAGDPNWIVVRPFPTRATNCVLPTWLFLPPNSPPANMGGQTGGGDGPCEIAYERDQDPVTGLDYVPYPTVSGPNGTLYHWPTGINTPNAYPGWNPLDESQGHNHGEGFFKQLGGNELPNAPHWTATVTGDYSLPLAGEWLMTLHTDIHWQSQSWWRVFNDHVYDKLHPYFTMNLAAIFTNEEAGWNVMAYVKNVTDETAITGAFLNSDDTGLTTNVFLTEPRLYGLRVTKEWTGGPLLGSFGQRRDGPYPFTVEIGGQVQRHDAPNETLRPDFIDTFETAGIDPSGADDQDLDWGDGRQVKLVYRPDAIWNVSLAARHGETNHGGRLNQEGETVLTCNLKYPCGGGDYAFINYSDYKVFEREEHSIVDFAVGRDIGLGAREPILSMVSLGVRYAQFNSRTDVSVSGTPDWQTPLENWGAIPGYGKYPEPAQHHVYKGKMAADREFEGVGPVLSWDLSKQVLGSNELGSLDVDISLSGGVLFGKQKTAIEGAIEGSYYDWTRYDWFVLHEGPVSAYETSLDATRSKSVTVPTAGLSVGLSYRIGGASVGAGYRWERYYDAIDGGITEYKSYDRTVDGPYMKLSVGFGG